jgi:hypothetical protein
MYQGYQRFLKVTCIDTPSIFTNNLIGLRGGGRERLAKKASRWKI